MSGHSPGPWKIKKHIVNRSLVSAEGEYILEGFGALPTEANLRLIAAAPELLEALKALRIDANRLCDRNLGGTYEADCRRSLTVAELAIAKAEGK